MIGRAGLRWIVGGGRNAEQGEGRLEGLGAVRYRLETLFFFCGQLTYYPTKPEESRLVEPPVTVPHICFAELVPICTQLQARLELPPSSMNLQKKLPRI